MDKDMACIALQTAFYAMNIDGFIEQGSEGILLHLRDVDFHVHHLIKKADIPKLTASTLSQVVCTCYRMQCKMRGEE